MGKNMQGEADYTLSRREADRLFRLEKGYFGQDEFDWPFGGKQIAIPILSQDKQNEFLLDVSSARLDLSKYTFQNRTRKIILLVRIDLQTSKRHRNPDGRFIVGPHIHHYREGFGDKWAEELPGNFGDPEKPFEVFGRFMTHCNITTVPRFQRSTIIEAEVNHD